MNHNYWAAKLTDPIKNETFNVYISRTAIELTTGELGLITIKRIPTTAYMWTTRELWQLYRYPLILETESMDDDSFHTVKVMFLLYKDEFTHNGSKFFGAKCRVVKDAITFSEYAEEIRTQCTPLYV